MELWEVILRDLIEHSRFYPVIAHLDENHRSQWILIQDGIDRVISATTDMIQTYGRAHISLLDLRDEWVISISSVRDTLILIEMNAYPKSVTVGPDPKVVIFDENMKKAVEAVNQLQDQLEELQKIIPDQSCASQL